MTKKVSEKRKEFLLILFGFVSLILLITSICAADVAYIYKSKPKIDKNILNVFSELNLTVDLINEKNLPASFANYRFIYAGNERFRKNIPVNNYPSVITNYYFGEKWGLTDDDGISKLAGTDPLSVIKDEQILQVYTQALYSTNRVAIPYFYLGNENKVPAMEKIAGTYIGNEDTFDLGDVVSVAKAGEHLINGKTAKGNICFFGIVESKYWTDDAKQLFIDCVGRVATTCSKDSDCPSDIVGDKYCKNGDVYQDTIDYSCANPGSVQSRCAGNNASILIEECSDLCVNGECREVACFNNSQCGTDGFVDGLFCQNNDVFQNYVTYTCNNPGSENSYCSNLTETKLKEECSEMCIDGHCSAPICNQNSDCGTDGFVDGLFCSNDDVFKNYINYTCHNSGQASSYCSNTTAIKLITDCGDDSCSNYGNNYCKGKDIYKSRTCHDKGCADGNCFDNTNTEEVLVQTCADFCLNGSCGSITCYNNSQCDDDDIYTLDDCNNPGTKSSYCSHTPINCINNNDCGTTGYIGSEFCSSDDVFKNYQNANCINSGTPESYCQVSVTQKLILDCAQTCSNGVCINIHVNCSSNLDCGNNSFVDELFCQNDDIFQNYVSYKCNNPGQITSSCSNSIIPQLKTDCGEDSCTAFGNNYCKGNDIYKSRTCNDKGCMLGNCFDNTNNEEVLIERCAGACSNGQCININCYKDSDCDDSDLYTLDKCINPATKSSYCTHTPINCINNNDCGTAGFIGSEFCSSNDVFKNYINANCINPGTSSSYCDVSQNPKLITDCGEDSCSNYGNNYCKGNDVFKSRTCHDKGCASGNCFDNTNNEEVLVQKCAGACSNGQCININCYKDSDCDDSDLYTLDKCVNPGIPSSYCTHTPINCINNNDCGTTGFIGSEFCSSNDVFKNYQNANCINPGTSSSYCDVSQNPKLITDCGDDSCSNYGNNYCKNGDVYKSRTCHDKGCMLGNCFDNTNNEEVLVDDCSADETCNNGECVKITCTKNSDCGADGFVNGLFCQNNDVFQNYVTYTCNNPGTSGSSCSNSIIPQLKSDCGDDSCGAFGSNYCKGKDVYMSRTCHDKGCMLGNCFDNTNTEEVLVQQCPDICSNGQCINIKCKKDSDCGTNGFIGNNFCQTEDVFQDYITYKCNNPGQANSYCTDTTTSQFKLDCGEDSCGAFGSNYCKGNDIYKSRTCHDKGCADGNCFDNPSDEEVLVERCAGACSNGQCININCYKDSDCDDSDLYTLDKCINPATPSSYCTHTPINCITNSDCGTTGFIGSEFCSSDDVFKNYQSANCINPGIPSSYCQISVIQKLITDCGEDSCSNYGNNYCKNGDVYKSRTCHDKGCMLGNCFDNTNTEEVLVDDCSADETCNNGVCVKITCTKNSDCGADGFVNGLFCQTEDVFQNYVTYTCNNPGTSGSSCSNSIMPQLITDCGEDSCGAFGSNYCKGKDVYMSRTCHDKGCMLGNCFDNTNTEEVLVQTCELGCSNGQCNICSSENLVKNPSFEESNFFNASCASTLKGLTGSYVKDWDKAYTGTGSGYWDNNHYADYMDDRCFAPAIYGFQTTNWQNIASDGHRLHSGWIGNGYAEYFQGSLKEPLIPGEEYEISFDIKGMYIPSYNGGTYISVGQTTNAGFDFYQNKLSYPGNYLTSIPGSANLVKTNSITLGSSYQTVTKRFVATNSANYFVVGSFKGMNGAHSYVSTDNYKIKRVCA